MPVLTSYIHFFVDQKGVAYLITKCTCTVLRVLKYGSLVCISKGKYLFYKNKQIISISALHLHNEVQYCIVNGRVSPLVGSLRITPK